MKFGPVDVEQCEGATLAHALVLPTRRLKKGHVLTSQDVDLLTAAKVETVIVALLENEDVAENEAARRLAQTLLSDQISVAAPFTGRVNLHAKAAGMFHAETIHVNAINKVSPSITLATLPDGTAVEAGRMVATVKIIPFAVEEETVSMVEKLTHGAGVITISPARSLRVGLIATQLPSLKPSAMDKTARILADRLKPSDSEICFEHRIGHDGEDLADCLRTSVDECDFLIVFGASAITDRADVIPSAIETAGGKVIYFGMPVDPGNLLLMGQLKGKPVIGAPGCARSPAENGFDWVLQRVLAGLPVDGDYISGLGVGGLLMEITARPQPREG